MNENDKYTQMLTWKEIDKNADPKPYHAILLRKEDKMGGYADFAVEVTYPGFDITKGGISSHYTHWAYLD